VLVVYHANQQVSRVLLDKQPLEVVNPNDPICVVITKLAYQYPEELLVWCHENVAHAIQLETIPSLVTLAHEIISFQPGYGGYFESAIEWVEESLFVAVPKHIRYATWMISAQAGAMQARLWTQIAPSNTSDSFDFMLHSIGKRVQSSGVFCYSEPALLNEKLNTTMVSASLNELYRFVKQHYKGIWVWILFWQQLRHQKKWACWALMSTWFIRRKKPLVLSIDLQPAIEPMTSAVSVLIPTLNRPQYLADFLADLQSQTLVPKEVIIIEQNPEPSSSSQLTAVLAQQWNFKVIHLFTHQLGVCNARNLGLAQVTGDWVFFADDDIRISSSFLEDSLHKINQNNAQAVSFACISPQQTALEKPVIQWNAFGGGSSLVAAKALHNCSFSAVFEHGFGEDLDFGMQLRRTGTDVLFFATPAITHLKAPSGGFRVKKTRLWEQEVLMPKPSPTVMAYLQRYYTPNQLASYKLLLLLKYYSKQSVKNPLLYYRRFQQQWKQSVYWASKLEQHP
jgi:glycosyltransferase involved in cell wall biosynthesis